MLQSSMEINKNCVGQNQNNLPSEIEKELFRLFPQRIIQRVLLIAPPDVDLSLFNYDSAKRGRNYNYPMYGPGIVASYLKTDDIEVSIINLNHETLKACHNSSSNENFDFDFVWKEKLKNILNEFQPDLVGITCMFTQTHKSTVLVCDEIKRLKHDLPIALGGVHITNSYANFEQTQSLLKDFSKIDLFFLYESEIAFQYFVRAVNKKVPPEEIYQIVFNSSERKLYCSQKKAPIGEELNVIPAYDLMNLSEISNYGVIGSFSSLKPRNTRFATALSNRGCRAQCTFCSVRNFNGKGVRIKSVQTVIDELLILKEQFGIEHIMWLDDDLLFDHKRVLTMFNEMVRQNVKITWDCTNGVIAASCTEEIVAAAAESGCIGLNIGMESGNSDILKEIKKPGKVRNFLRAADILRQYPQINARVFLIIGFPNETYRMILDTLKVSIEMELDWYNLTILHPLPNTPIFDTMVQLGLVDDVDSKEVRYNTGPYGKKRSATDKSPLIEFTDVFENINLDQVPLKSELENIWMYMNFHLNFKRLLKLENPLKIDQQSKYLQYITELVAPDDPFPMYFYGQLQKKIHGTVDKNLIARLDARLAQSDYWSNSFEHFDLSTANLKN